MAVINDIANPKKGKCQIILPNVFILLVFSLTVPLRELIILEAWNCNATSSNDGPEKTVVYRCSNSSPRHMRENHYALSLYTFESFSGFHSQEISITLLFSKIRKDNHINPNTKLQINYDNRLFSKLFFI